MWTVSRISRADAVWNAHHREYRVMFNATDYWRTYNPSNFWNSSFSFTSPAQNMRYIFFRIWMFLNHNLHRGILCKALCWHSSFFTCFEMAGISHLRQLLKFRQTSKELPICKAPALFTEVETKQWDFKTGHSVKPSSWRLTSNDRRKKMIEEFKFHRNLKLALIFHKAGA